MATRLERLDRLSVRMILESQPFLITANVLAGILSVVVIGLVADVLAWERTSGAQHAVSTIGFNITVNGTEAYDTAVVGHLPTDVRVGSYWLMLACGIGGFIDAILLGAMQCWRRLKSASLQAEHGETFDRNLKPQTPLSIFIAVFAFCRSLAGTIYAFQEWAASGTFTPQQYLPLNAQDKYTKDFFTPDAWTCQYEDYVLNDGQQRRLQNLCTEGTAARTVTLAICVLYVFVVYGVVYRAFRRRLNARRQAQFRDFDASMTMRSNMSQAPTVTAESYVPRESEK